MRTRFRPARKILLQLNLEKYSKIFERICCSQVNLVNVVDNELHQSFGLVKHLSEATEPANFVKREESYNL